MKFLEPFWKKTLKNQVFMMNICILLFAIVIMGVATLQVFSGYMMRTQKTNTDRELQIISNHLDLLMETTENYLRVLSVDPNLKDIIRDYDNDSGENKVNILNLKREMGKIVSNMIAPNTQIPCAVIFSGDKILYSGYRLDEKDVASMQLSHTKESELETYLPQWESVRILPYSDKVTEYVFPISKAIVDKENGERIGVVYFFLREKDIEKVYRKTGSENKYYLIDQDGIIISAADKQLIGTEHMPANQKGHMQTQFFYNSKNWIIICDTDLTLYYKERTKIIEIIVSILLCLIIASIYLAYKVSDMVTRPLVNVVNSIQARGTKRNSESNDELHYIGKEFFSLLSELEKAEKQNYEYQKSRRKSELKLLQAQIKPHFLYNTMGTVASLIRLDEKQQAIETVQDISMFYRNSLSNGQEIITIQKEQEIIEYYLKIQCVRYHEKMEYSIEIPEYFAEYTIPKLSLQPLVENAIYHGIKNMEEKGIIIIRGYEEKSSLVFEVFDSGVGMEQEKVVELNRKLRSHQNTTTHEGFGLHNVNDRIQLYYGEDYGLFLESVLGEYTQVKMVIPKQDRGKLL